jgi:hypothetical protein
MRMRMPRWTPLTACASLAATVAVIGSPGHAAADTVPYSNLPVVPLPASTSTSPSQLPLTIPATEHVDGLFVALQPDKMRKPMEDKNGYHYVSIFTTDKAAQAYSTDGSYRVTYPDDRTAPRTCLLSGGRSLSQRMTTLFRVRPYVPPPPSAQTIARLKAMHRWPPKPPKVAKPTTPVPPHDDMQRVSLEKVTVTGDTAKVDVTDAVLDLKTLGTHLLGSTSTTLARIGTGPSGMGIFASRDDKGRVQFLVTSPDLPAPEADADRQRQVERLSDMADRVMAELPSGDSAENGCGHVRFSMDAIKPGSGEMATILSTAFLPPSSDPDENSTDDGSTQDPSDDDNGNSQQSFKIHSQRARPVALNLSLSQLPSESAPLLSLSFGWAGKDEQLSFLATGVLQTPVT